MKKKNSLILDNEFIQYCELNNITDMDKLAKETFEKGFSLLKYGETPKVARGKDKVIEKEIIKEVEVEKIIEVIKEVPVEKIVEVVKEVPVEKIVEVIKEVPVEVKGDTKVIVKEVIKEVPVEKVVEVVKEITNTTEVDRLIKENQDLKSQLEKITNSLNKLSKGRFLKNSDLNTLYDE
jgi:Mg/Co/Ni transporter MgtE